MSTSGSYAQCCPITGACPFFTACSSNTLLAASASPVPCDVDPGLTCNTAVLATTAGANVGASYLACWQSSLGSGPFTFVQDIGSACEYIVPVFLWAHRADILVAVAAATPTRSASASGSLSQASITGSGSSIATQTTSGSSATESPSSTASTDSSVTTSGASIGSASSSSASASSSSGAGLSAVEHGLESVLISAFGVVARILL